MVAGEKRAVAWKNCVGSGGGSSYQRKRPLNSSLHWLCSSKSAHATTVFPEDLRNIKKKRGWSDAKNEWNAKNRLQISRETPLPKGGRLTGKNILGGRGSKADVVRILTTPRVSEKTEVFSTLGERDEERLESRD